jgi:hypothetical protein
MSKMGQAIETIGQAIHDFMDLSSDNPEEKPLIDAVNELIDHAEQGYALVIWPDDQKYMEASWFNEEAHPTSGDYLGHFIPIKRLML